MEKTPMPEMPPAGYFPERPCSMTPEGDAPLPSPPREDYTRQNPFRAPAREMSDEEDAPNTRGGGRTGNLLEVLCAACCCYAICEVCC